MLDISCFSFERAHTLKEGRRGRGKGEREKGRNKRERDGERRKDP